MTSEQFYKDLDKIVKENLPSFKVISVNTNYLLFESRYEIKILLEKEEQSKSSRLCKHCGQIIDYPENDGFCSSECFEKHQFKKKEQEEENNG